MIIEYLNPFSRAWNRTKNILFTPFDIGKWFALGFTAFLAHLTNMPSGGGGRGSNYHMGRDADWDYIFDFPNRILPWAADHPFWSMVIIAGFILAIVVYVVLVWLSSRGIFMFLDNVVHNRSLIEKPWREFKNRGESIFLWRLALGCVFFIMVIEFIIATFYLARGIYFHGEFFSSRLFLLLGLAFIGLALFLTSMVLSKLLTDFVVPIMYKDDVSVIEAWNKFLHLFSENVSHFILYIFFIIGLYIVVGIGVAIFGLITCCCGFVLLIIPYIGSIVMLPVSVTFRAFSVEFLEQFGEEYKIFPVTGGPVPPAGETAIPIV
jgi:hypothetical protein